MKTKIFLSLALVVFSISLIAENGVKRVTSIEETKIEETIVYNERTHEPIQKSLCEFNSFVQVIEKTVYKADKYGNWTPSCKYEMTYSSTDSKQPCTITYTRWNPVKERWEDFSKTMKCME